MNALELLQTIETRGGMATLKRDELGAAKVNVAPRSLALELLPEIRRLKPELLDLLQGAPANRLNPQRVQKTDEADERARALLAKYRRGGAVLSLETVERDGATWRALYLDLTGVSPEREARANAQIETHARTLARALELESIGDADEVTR